MDFCVICDTKCPKINFNDYIIKNLILSNYIFVHSIFFISNIKAVS